MLEPLQVFGVYKSIDNNIKKKLWITVLLLLSIIAGRRKDECE